MAHLVASIDALFTELGIKRVDDWIAEGGHVSGVGKPNNQVENVWNDEELGLLDGTAPEMLVEGQTIPIALDAVASALGRFNRLLGPASIKADDLTITF